MRKQSPLGRYLDELTLEGEHQSTGQFTISPEKALEKLATFSLPLPESWILCLIQFAVGSGAENINICLTNKTIQFQADLPDSWFFPDFEKRLYELPGNLPNELESLLLAFWQASFAQGRQLLFSPPSGPSYILQDGSLSEQTDLYGLGGSFWVEVSHQSRDPLELKPAMLNAELLSLINERAFVCPIPLAVDGRRLDSLVSLNESTLLDLYELQVEAPKMRVPRLGIPYGLNRGLKYEPLKLLSWDGPDEVCGFCLFYLPTPRLGYPKTTEPESLMMGADRSSIHWVSNGVVVDKGTIMLPRSGFCFHLFLSGEGLAQDLSGQLVRDQTYKNRRRQALSAVAARLANGEHNFAFPAEKKTKTAERKYFFGLITLFEPAPPSLPDRVLRKFEHTVEEYYLKLTDEFKQNYDSSS